MERKRGKQFANGRRKKKWRGPFSAKDERRGEKKITSVCLERARVSYRAGAKVVLKNTIINCHLHLRCKARGWGWTREKKEGGRRGGTLFAEEIIQ